MIVIQQLWKRMVIVLNLLLYYYIKAVTPKSGGDYNKILILYISGIGDTICLTPFYERIRKKFPQAELWSCFPEPVTLLQNTFFAFDGNLTHKGYLKTIKDIRRQRFDLVILPGWILKDSLIALCSNTREILGYINELSFSNRYLNRFLMQSTKSGVKPLWQDMTNCHLSERANAILKHFEIEPVKASDLSFSRTLEQSNIVVIHAGATFEGRRWDPQNFAKVAIYLLNVVKCSKIILIGDKSDSGINQFIINAAASPYILNQAGKLSLLETKRLIDKARIFVGNDSGPMHIAAISGIPTLGLLGPNFPYISGPGGKQNLSVFHLMPCTGCNQRGCSFNFKCIKSIHVDEVTSQIGRLLYGI